MLRLKADKVFDISKALDELGFSRGLLKKASARRSRRCGRQCWCDPFLWYCAGGRRFGGGRNRGLGVARHAGKFGLVDHPNERSSHDTITPRGGGVGIFQASLLSAIGVGMSPWFWLPMGAIAALAFVGDWRESSPKVRLPVQLLLTGEDI